MMRPTRRQRQAGTLIVTLATLTAVSLMAAYTLLRVMPRIRMAYQNAAWEEARVAAEAGVDAAVGDLIVNATGWETGTWQGWKDDPKAGPSVKNLPHGLLQQLLTATGDRLTKLLNKLLQKGYNPEAVETTAPIFLDNLKVSASGGLPAEVDISLWALTPNKDEAHKHWFRIRSTATCALPPKADGVPANLDAALRRFSLKSVRPSLRKNDVGAPSTVALPNVTRTVEVLVEPILPFELALWTSGSISLASTGQWSIDSFDSSDPLKSQNGSYPGRNSGKTDENGSIATGQARPFSALYGPLIAANGTKISGAVATNGGDDPATEEFENVSGNSRIDPERIRNDFVREMPRLERPEIKFPLPPPLLGNFVPGPATVPAIYRVTGNLTQLRIASAPTGTVGTIVIMIDGDLHLKEPLILPPSVAAILFVRGNITFENYVNAGPWNSNRATQLMIFADGGTGLYPQTVKVVGPVSVCAALYGPKSAVTLDGNAHWIGSLAAGSFQVYGGGDGGIHYDRALGLIGPPISFRIARYVEDVRE